MSLSGFDIRTMLVSKQSEKISLFSIFWNGVLYCWQSSPLKPGMWNFLLGKNFVYEFSFFYIYIYWRRQWHPTPVLSPGKIPWTEGPGGLQSMGSLRVGHDWATSLWLFTFMHWRRKWQPTPVFLPGESQGWRNLVGCRLWGRTESDTTEVT